MSDNRVLTFESIFQSTPPARGATRRRTWRRTTRTHFNPRPPRGGRLTYNRTADFTVTFQSTPPARGATQSFHIGRFGRSISIHAPREGGDITHIPVAVDVSISIHAPREGGDYFSIFFRFAPPNFNPRPPRGGRRERQQGFDL